MLFHVVGYVTSNYTLLVLTFTVQKHIVTVSTTQNRLNGHLSNSKRFLLLIWLNGHLSNSKRFLLLILWYLRKFQITFFWVAYRAVVVRVTWRSDYIVLTGLWVHAQISPSMYSLPTTSWAVSLVQDRIYSLGKSHSYIWCVCVCLSVCPIPSLRILYNVAFETVPIFTWVAMAPSRPFNALGKYATL